MLVNSVSAQTNNFNGNWHKATLNASNINEALKIIHNIQYLAQSVPKRQKVFIRAVGDNGALDISQLGGLGCIAILGDKNFEYRVTGKKYPKIILNALKACFNCETSQEALDIASRAKVEYALQRLKKPLQAAKKALSKEEITEFINNLRVFFRPGEKSNPDELLTAIGKVMQTKSPKEAKRIAIAVTGKPIDIY